MFKNNRGFTLIEMLIVLLIISVLIILIVPNLGNRSANVNEKGCEALEAMVQAQVDAYHLEENEYPADLATLQAADYISEDQMTCPNGESLSLDENKVTRSK